MVGVVLTGGSSASSGSGGTPGKAEYGGGESQSSTFFVAGVSVGGVTTVCTGTELLLAVREISKG